MPAELTRNTVIIGADASPAIAHAARALRRDLNRVLSASSAPGATIRLEQLGAPGESFQVALSDGDVVLRAGDDLGFVYGLYRISRELLGVPDFWFWNDHAPAPRDRVELPADLLIDSIPAAVRRRGWFVNDEVLLETWKVDGDADIPWEMVFETLLRCGGNVVIPGTDAANVARHIGLASRMGLEIAQHHAEPLGAQMFVNRFPELTASYPQHPDLFRRLWTEAIADKRDHRVVWNLGFRGQGDRPFWEDDPTFETVESRGELVSGIIREQFDMLRAQLPDAAACVYLYGEILELYRAGVLHIPEDITKIWADNGYGRMVSRRQGNENPRVPAFPDPDDRGANGIYYHASFYDLQAANHITMLPVDAERVAGELREVLARGMDDLWIVNCSNVKPHVYFLDLLAQLWRHGDVDVAVHRRRFAEEYYGDGAVGDLYRDYADAAVAFGQEWDERAGEQFSNHVPRILMSHFLRDRSGSPAEDLRWLTSAASLPEQIHEIRHLFEDGMLAFSRLLDTGESVASALPAAGRTLTYDTVLLHARVQLECLRGAVAVCESVLSASEGDLRRAFLFASRARRHYLRGDRAMRDREHGRWIDFYANDCLADVSQSAWLAQTLMSALRNLGDGPHFYRWQRDLLYPAAEQGSILVLRREKTVDDVRLAELMEARWGDGCDGV